jgi:hypothetical protein
MARDIAEEIFNGEPKSETVAEFYQALAQALTTWQMVERAMLIIAQNAIRPEIPGSFMAAFHSLQHTASQLRMTNAALNFWFTATARISSPLKDEWGGQTGKGGLFKKINKCLDTRNSLAHFSAYVEPQNHREHEKIYLEPAATDMRYATGKTKSRYSVTEIRAAGDRFQKLSQEMWDFSHAMVRLATPHELYPPPHT